MKRIIPLIILLLCGGLQLQAQSIGIVPNSFQVRVNQRPFSATDTIRTGDAITYRLTYQNTGTANFITPINLVLATSDSLVQDTLFDIVPVDTLMVGDSTSRTYQDSVEVGDRLYFSANGGGAIVVVVWPAVVGTGQPNIPVTDSSSIILYRDYPLATDCPVGEGLSLYPNPATNELKYHLFGVNKKIDHVRIVDAVGRNVLLNKDPMESIDIQALRPGRYWFRLRFHDGSFLTRGFIKK